MGEGEIPSHENGSLVTQLRERGIDYGTVVSARPFLGRGVDVY